MATACPQCGHMNDPAAVYCAQCGASVGAAPAPSGGGRIAQGKTVLGMSVNDLPPPPAAPATPAPGPAPPVAAPTPGPALADPPGRAKTALGIPGMAPPTAGGPAPSNVPAPPGSSPSTREAASRTVLGMPAISTAPVPPSAAAPPAPTSASKTMLGVAIPGIAPLGPGSQAPAVPPSAVPASGARVEVQNENRTMLGVPAPGAAAQITPSLMTASVPIVPAPAPLHLEPLPAAPKKVERRGLPLGLVFGGLAALVIGVGVTAFFLLKGSSPLVVEPRLSPKGTDVLHLRCDSCPDGTKVTLGPSSAEFKNKEVDLELASPLVVGENPLTLRVDRPGSGRDEDVKAPVPVRYRIRTDLSGLADPKPTIKVLVEAESGATIKLDDKPFALDATGKGSLSLDVSAETMGMADETKTIEKTIPYEVTLKDRTEKGAVTARAPVPALRIDAPLTKTVIASDRFYVAGRTIKGATVSINGRPINVDATGIFSEPFGAPTVTEIPIEVKAALPQSAPRTVSLKIRRSDQLEAQARAADKATPPIPYAELLANTASFAGKPRALEGEVIEARETNRQTVLLVRDKRACDKPEGCIIRLVHGASIDAKAGTRVLAIGRVTRSLTAGGATVPEIEAEMVVPLGRPR